MQGDDEGGTKGEIRSERLCCDGKVLCGSVSFVALRLQGNLRVKKRVGKRSMKDTYQINFFLNAMRKEQGLTLEYAEGLCGKGELNRIEKGERIPPKLLLEALLERLGVSLEYYGVLYSKRGYELEQRKQQIQELLNNRLFHEVEQQIQELEEALLQEENLSIEKFQGSLDKKSVWKLWKQFFCHVNLCLRLGKGIPAEELKEGTVEAIRLTVPGFPDRITKTTRYGKEEVSLLSFYGDLLWQTGKQKDSLSLYEYLCDYAWEKIADRTEKVKIYPGLLLKLAQKKWAAGQKTDGSFLRSLNLLREEHKFYFLAEWIRFREESGKINVIRESYNKGEIFALKGMAAQPGSREFQRAEREAAGFFQLLLKKNWKDGTSDEWLYLSWQGEGHKTFAHYQFFSCCQQQNVTNEMLATLDVTSHMISRLERGERVRQSTYQWMMERIGAKGDYYQPILKTNEISVFQARRELVLYMGQKNFQAAEERLEFLKRKLDQEEAINCQIILFYQAIIDKRMRRKEKEELRADLEKALYLTIPRNCNIEQYPLSQIEIRILNQMACLENTFGNIDEAIRILQSIVASYQNNPMGKEADISGYFLVMSNLVNYLGDVGEYEEGIRYSEESIQDAYRAGMVYSLIEALYDKAWCVKRLYWDRDTRDACLIELRQAFSLAVLIDYRYMRSLIEEYCIEEYQVSLEEWLKSEE